MSFLSILLVASAFYFVLITSWLQEANARPDSQPTSESLDAAVPAKLKAPEDSSMSTMDPKDYQHQLYDFMDEMSNAIDKHMTPLMSKLDKKKKNEMKAMCLNGFASYINYLLLLIQEIVNEKSKDGQSQFFDGSFPRHEMILEFSAPQQISTPFMANYEIDDDEAE